MGPIGPIGPMGGMPAPAAASALLGMPRRPARAPRLTGARSHHHGHHSAKLRLRGAGGERNGQRHWRRSDSAAASGQGRGRAPIVALNGLTCTMLVMTCVKYWRTFS